MNRLQFLSVLSLLGAVVLIAIVFAPATTSSLLAGPAALDGSDDADGDGLALDDLDKPWAEILGPSQALLPDPLDEIGWRDDIDKAMRDAKRQDRPMFVTFRCLPCEQCSDFDTEVLEGGIAIDPLLKQFITVRLTTARGIDLRLFPMADWQDMDMSWWGYFMSPEGRIYGVYGGRDDVSVATHISLDGLRSAMRRVLDHHYDPRREDWDVDGDAPRTRGRAQTPERLDGYRSYIRARPGVGSGECLHCHHVSEIIRQEMIDDDEFDTQTDLGIWPLPQNVGLSLDRDHGLLVTDVEAGSFADDLGIEKGDVLGAAGGRRLHSQTDFRAMLHQGPQGDGEIEMVWLRDDQVMAGTLDVSGDWRATVLDWRISVSQGNIGAGPGFWPNNGGGERQRLGLGSDVMCVRPWLGNDPSVGYRQGPAWAAGLRNNHILTAVDGESPNIIGREFMTWFRLNHNPGDLVTLTVYDQNGRESQIQYRLAGGD